MKGVQQVRRSEVSPSAPVAAFCAVRNERRMLPDLLRHHRHLGVREFYFVDNDSNDGTFEWLAAQPDVTLYHTKERYSESRCGTDWINGLVHKHGLGRWCLYLDADEHFVYRNCENLRFDDYVAQLDRIGATGVLGFMLDCYPDGSLNEAAVRDDLPLRESCPLFDGDYVFRRYPCKPWATPGFPAIEVLGGPRLRMASSLTREARTNWVHYFLRGQVDRIIDYVPERMFPFYVRYLERRPPALQKVALVKPTDVSFAFGNGAHDCTELSIAPETAVLLHYKFTSEFQERVVREAARGEHYRRGAQYLRYVQLFEERGTIDLRYPGSRSYQSSSSLVDAALFWQLSSLARA